MHRLRRLFSRRGDERLDRDVIVLGIIAFFVMLGFGVVIPVLPVYVRSFDVGFVEIGAVVSAFALFRLIATPFVGRLVDRGGERTILAIGIGIVAVSSGLVGIAGSYAEVLMLRGAGGIGSAMFSVSAMTLLLSTAAPESRARSVGFYQGGFLVGGMAGPAVGGVLAAFSLRAPFFFYAATLIVAGIIGLVLLRKPTAVITADAPPQIPLGVVLRDRRFVAACVANFAQGWGSMGARSALIPVLVVEVLRGTSAWTGVAFAIAAVVQTLCLGPAGRFVDRVGRRPAMVGAFTAAAILLMAISVVPNFAVLTVLLCLYGAAAAFMGTAPAASLGDAAGARNARPVAIFSAFSDAGAVVGPLVVGALLDSFSWPIAFGSAAALMLVAAAVSVTMPRRISGDREVTLL
ncbi:MFS transporter [Salinibacterium hongtaonis]|nr:MFS transporter [Salinibacterium hongtaonis]